MEKELIIDEEKFLEAITDYEKRIAILDALFGDENAADILRAAFSR